MEKIVKPMSGYLALIIALASGAASVFCFVNAESNGTVNGWFIFVG